MIYAHVKNILRRAYSTPPRPMGNMLYISGIIQTLSDLELLTEEDTNNMFDLLVHKWSHDGPIPNELNDHYASLQAGDTIICTKEVVIDENVPACSEVAFSVDEEYTINNIINDPEGLILEVINNQGERHLMDNNKDGDYFFDTYFKVK